MSTEIRAASLGISFLAINAPNFARKVGVQMCNTDTDVLFNIHL